MAIKFPSAEWLQALEDKLNSDEKYARIARKWEGDIMFNVEPGGPLNEPVLLYTDLWHGKCRAAFVVTDLLAEVVRTGKTVAYPFFSAFEFKDGLINRERFFFDLARLCDGIGLPMNAVADLLKQLRAAA